eukprot:6487497-Prymnesium_polylepis.1
MPINTAREARSRAAARTAATPQVRRSCETKKPRASSMERAPIVRHMRKGGRMRQDRVDVGRGLPEGAKGEADDTGE